MTDVAAPEIHPNIVDALIPADLSDLIGGLRQFPRAKAHTDDTVVAVIACHIGVMGRHIPKEVDGGDWWSLTLTWQTDDDTKEVNYIWPDSEEAAAFERLLEEIALSVK